MSNELLTRITKMFEDRHNWGDITLNEIKAKLPYAVQDVMRGTMREKTPEPIVEPTAQKLNIKIKRSKDAENVWGFEPVGSDAPTPQDREESEESEHPEFRFKSSNYPEHKFTTPDGTQFVYFEGNYFLKLSTLPAG